MLPPQNEENRMGDIAWGAGKGTTVIRPSITQLSEAWDKSAFLNLFGG